MRPLHSVRCWNAVLVLAAAVAVGACNTGAPPGSGEHADGGDAGSSGDGGIRDDGAAPVSSVVDGGSDGGCSQIVARLRDFQDTHPDFEKFSGNSVLAGIVEPMLDGEHKPVHAAVGGTAATSGRANFSQWYRDIPNVNISYDEPLPLTSPAPGQYVFDSSAFFPLDNKGFGNQGRNHNFHFTTEIHTAFTYKGGEVFTFKGDDDVWVFVNRRLALDLGGVHGVETGTLNFNAKAAELGLTVGKTYPLDVFHAERHTVESNFRIETSIECFVPQIN